MESGPTLGECTMYPLVGALTVVKQKVNFIMKLNIIRAQGVRESGFLLYS